MADNDGYNSSDEEFEPALPKKYAHAGQQSIDDIISNAFQERVESKKRAKQLTFRSSTRETSAYHQALWMNRFDAFREHALKIS